MTMHRSGVKVKALRFVWGLFPWLIVAIIVFFMLKMGGRIMDERARIAEAKKAAMKKEIEPVRVITLTLKPRRVLDKISLPGEVESYENLWVKAEVPGQVVRVLVEEGQIVKKGDILIQLDDRDYRSRLARIEANHKLAKLDYERHVTLVKKKIVAEAKLDEYEARLKDLSAQRREAKLAIGRARIKAPISGRLNEIKAEKGEVLAVGDPVAQILESDRVKVTVGVPESDVAAVFDLQQAEVAIEALGGLRVTGTKIFLSRKPRTLARLYDLELSIPNPDGFILPGMFARVELVKKTYEEAIAVPLYAVITRGDEHFVFVEENGLAQRRVVKLGVLEGWQVHVQEGLKAGERVIIVGHRLLDSGQAVKVMKNTDDPREILG